MGVLVGTNFRKTVEDDSKAWAFDPSAHLFFLSKGRELFFERGPVRVSRFGAEGEKLKVFVFFRCWYLSRFGVLF